MIGSESSRTEYFRRLIEDAPRTVLESSSSFRESVPSAELNDTAIRATEALREGRPLSDEHRMIMEAIVVPYLRPVYDVQNDGFPPLPDPWGELNRQDQKLIKAIKSIGRLEIGGLPGVPYGGTGFIVGPNLIMTNRHVAELITSSVGDFDLKFIPGRSASVDLKQEVMPTSPIRLEVLQVRMVHPYWDAAILAVRDLPEGHGPLTLASTPPDDLTKSLVAVVGYPALDSRGDISTQIKMFHGVFEKKRLLPGYTMGLRQIESYGHVVEALAHDCSTLGGNSGSAVIDPSSGFIIGLHFAGIEMQANFAVPAWELARDPRIVDAGVIFADAQGTPSLRPEVTQAWTSVSIAPHMPTEAVSPAPGTHVAYPLDWFERSSTEDVVQALAIDPQGASNAIRAILSPEHAEQTIRDLTPPAIATEGLLDYFDPDPDPSLPEIIWLHGIMGGHLASPGFLRQRIWLDPVELFAGDLSTGLTLQSDGMTSMRGRNLESDGMIQMFYGTAEHKWRKNRFVVHDYSYDWRLSIDQLADQLHVFLSGLRQQQPSRRFLVVAHSMGGLVASNYAQRHPEWRDSIQRAIFLGVPLGGSYAPLQAFIGTYDFLKKLAMISARVSLDAMRRMAVTLPGLVDMLPSPNLFPETSECYRSCVWPSDSTPAQRWLDHSYNLKPVLTSSPLLDRTTLLVSLGYPTIVTAVTIDGKISNGQATGAGDGTVPAKASVIDGIPAFKVNFDHANLPKDPKAIQAVIDLARTGTCSLDQVQPEDLTTVFAPKEHLVFQEGAMEGIKIRWEQGQLRESDVEWLFRPGIDAPPD